MYIYVDCPQNFYMKYYFFLLNYHDVINLNLIFQFVVALK